MPKVKSHTGARLIVKKDVEPALVGKWYPAEGTRKVVKRAFTPGVAKLRSTITPGTVLILLAGRFRGKRVVFLKQLPSGLLLVTGPYAVNGVPLRRVNQSYVIATSTKVNVAGVKVPEAVNDSFFKAAKAKRLGQGKEAFEALTKAAAVLPAEKKATQAAVDAGFKLDATTSAYLKARFALSKGDKPHEMKF